MNLKILILLSFVPFVGCHSVDAETPVVDTVRQVEMPAQEPLVQQHPVDAATLPKDYFAPPMKIPVSLSATFGEIRANHFHGGIDLRVGGKVGEPVYAAAEGYVSRIKVSPWGGGKHVYITHPNGFRTVYMHLDGYAGEMAKFVSDWQYKHQLFAFDVDLPVDSIKVEKGQLIGYAGNTGSSGGPHLHYEIRYADNDQPINPLYFGMEYSDPIAPTIVNLKLYPADDASLIDGAHKEWFQTTTRKVGKRHVTVTADSVCVSGRFYAGIYTYDKSEKNDRKNGVERIEIYVDGDLFAVYGVPSYIYEETRAINAQIDYQQYQKTREYYVITRQLPGIRYPKITAVRDSGYLSFNDNALHKMEFRVYDYKGNVAKQTLKVRDVSGRQSAVGGRRSAVGSQQSAVSSQRSAVGGQQPAVGGRRSAVGGQSSPANPKFRIRYSKSKVIDTAGFRLTMKPYTLYADDELVVRILQRKAGFYGNVYTIYPRDNDYPPNCAYTIELPMPRGVKVDRSKLLICSVAGKKSSAVETRMENGVLKADVKNFGSFTVAADTVPPVVKPSNFKDGATVTNKELRLKITDDFSGIATYNCFIGGRWVLAEYDPKVAALIIDTKSLKKGQNTLAVKVADAVGNLTEAKYTLYRQ